MNRLERAWTLLETQRFAEAVPLLESAVRDAPTSGEAHYALGTCYRFLENYAAAVEHLICATELTPERAHVLLALGIALQLNDDLERSASVLERAIHLEPEYPNPYNSLGVTWRKMGEPEKAAAAYSGGLKALVRRHVRSLTNDRANRIYKQRDTRGLLWVEYATYGAAYSASLVEGITGIAMPSAASAMEEERTERNAGLYWIDKELPDGRSRVFLPNFFNTIREYFAREPLYSGLLANRARVLEMIGDLDARLHADEAYEFASPDLPPETTVVKWSFPRRS